MVMKRLMVPILLSLVLLCGCAQHYVMKLSNGGRITTSGKPKLKGNDYVYTDIKGRPQRVSQGSVVEIEPASMAKKEKSPFILAPSR